ncbi:MAG TPA: MlaD family protein [Polyangiales bacterium]|nr:MlaD family protein [Polyangiales bacterium]
MSAPTNHWKLGLFVITGVLVGLGGVVLLMGHLLHKDMVRYTSYFDEGVGGLNTGSAVSYRGVTIGNVSAINIARDRRHVEIKYDLGVDELKRLGLIDEEDKDRIRVPPDLRVQIGSNGLTGSKYLQLDFFLEKTHPPPKLPFPVPKKYIPATPSTFKSLENSITQAVDTLPLLAKQLDALLSQVNNVVDEVRDAHLPTHAAETFAAANATIRVLHDKLQQVPMRELSGDLRQTMGKLHDVLTKADSLVAHADSDTGVLKSVQRASDNMGDVAGNASGVVTDLGSTMRDLRETIDAIRHLAEALETDSDMLIKGRAKGTE